MVNGQDVQSVKALFIGLRIAPTRKATKSDLLRMKNVEEVKIALFAKPPMFDTEIFLTK